MACVITDGIALDCIEGLGGIKTAWILGGTITGYTYNGTDDITDIAGTGTYFKFELPKDTASFTQTANIAPTNGTLYYTQELTMNFQKMDTAKRNVLKLVLKNRDLSVVFEDNNGTYWLLGKTRGCQASASTGVTGTAPGDANQFTLTLQGMEPDPAQIVIDFPDATTGITVE